MGFFGVFYNFFKIIRYIFFIDNINVIKVIFIIRFYFLNIIRVDNVKRGLIVVRNLFFGNRFFFIVFDIFNENKEIFLMF